MKRKTLGIFLSIALVVLIMPHTVFGIETGFVLQKNSTESVTYSKLKDAVDNAPRNKYSSTITLNEDSTDTDVIRVAGNQNITIDLNGHKICAASIYNYGNLIITDSKNTEGIGADLTNYIQIGNGEVASQIYNSGSLVVKSGKFDVSRVKYDDNDTVGKDLSAYIFKSPNEEFEQSSHIYKSKKSGDNSYYVLKTSNLDFVLCYEIFDSNGDMVKSADSDEIQDISIGETYTVKMYIKSKSKYDVKLNGFDVTMIYKIMGTQPTDTSISDRIVIDTPYDETNKYFSVKKSISGNIGVLKYVLENGSYVIPAGTDSNGIPVSNYEGIKIAQYNMTVKPDGLDVDKKIQLGFAGLGEYKDTSIDYVQKISVMNGETDSFLGNVSVIDGESKTVNTKNVFDGVYVASYKYSPEGYLLAVISKEHGNDEIMTYGKEKVPMYFTSNPNYVALSTNPAGVKARYSMLSKSEIEEKEYELNCASPSDTTKLGRVYLKLISLKELVNEGYLKSDEINDFEKINEAVKKKLTVCKISDINRTDLTDESFLLEYNLEFKQDKSGLSGLVSPYDVDCDGTVDYNDASIVYEMLQNGGDYWNYDSDDTTNYLGEKGRLHSAASGSGKLYGSIEDVAEIINNYSK